MPIILPQQSQSIRPVSGNVERVPVEGQGARRLGQALQGVAQDVNEIEQGQFQEEQTRLATEAARYDKIQAKLNTTNLLEAETTLDDMFRAQRAEIEKRRGSDAQGVTVDTEKWFDENIKKVADTLGNDDVRVGFSVRSQNKRQAALDSVASYEANQINIWTSETSAAKIQSNIGFAAANAGNPAAVSLARSENIGVVDAQAKLMGWSPERKQFELEKVLTGMHKEVFENLANQSPEAAKAYFEKHKNEIDGAQWDDFKGIIKEADYRIGAQRIVDGLMLKKMTWEERRAEVKKVAEGQMEEYANNMLEEEQRRETAATAAEYDVVLSDAYKLFGPTQRISSIPPVMWAKLDGKDQQALRDKERIAKEGGRVISDRATYHALNQLAANDPDAFLATISSPKFLGVNLTEEDFKHFSNYANKIQSGAGNSISTLEQDINAAVGQLNEEERDAFSRSVRNIVSQTEIDLKRQLTDPERKKIVTDARVKTYDNSFANKVREYLGFEKTGAVVGIELGKIPDAQREQIEEALRGNGMPVSPQNILELYNAVIKK